MAEHNSTSAFVMCSMCFGGATIAVRCMYACERVENPTDPSMAAHSTQSLSTPHAGAMVGVFYDRMLSANSVATSSNSSGCASGTNKALQRSQFGVCHFNIRLFARSVGKGNSTCTFSRAV